jgi:hypothetical protein
MITCVCTMASFLKIKFCTRHNKPHLFNSPKKPVDRRTFRTLLNVFYLAHRSCRCAWFVL